MSKITVPYSFDELNKEARDLFKQAGFDVSDGSNTSQLSAVISYLIATLNTNTALNINETLLPYAVKRKNVLQDARVLGYEAVHKTSYVYRLTVTLNEKLIGYGAFTVPKYYKVSANGNDYYYCGDDFKIDLGSVVLNGVYVNPSDMSFEDDNVYYNGNDITDLYNEAKRVFKNNYKLSLLVKEGSLITYDTDVSSLTKTIDSITVNGLTKVRNYIDIPYTDVENDGIECLVSYFDEYSNYQEDVRFYKTDDYFFESDGEEYVNKCFLRIDDIQMSTPRVYFKYADMGKGLPLNSIVKFNLIITSGTEGSMGELKYTQYGDDISYEGVSLSSLSNDDSSISNVFDGSIITACELVQTGNNEESSESIRTNAPRVYNSAHRLVTNLDYQSACNRSTYVADSVVWGGEDEFPRAPGHIWFSFLPEKKSERKFASNTYNTYYKRENSTLVYNYAEGETKYQHALRQKYYQKNYILDTEIKNYENGRYTGVWGDLVGKYVPSLTFHHRHPLYLNFDYTFNILRYNIKDNTSVVHSELFNILDNCFYGDDSLNLEKFNVDYFHTNIVRRIDNKISDMCGFTCSLNTSIILNEKTCCTENYKSEYKDIYIPLCVPFEKYFMSNGFLDIDRLPCIDTENFIDYRYDDIKQPLDYEYGDDVVNKYTNLRYSIVSGDLYTDWSKIKADQTYRIDNNLDNDIPTKLFVAPVKINMSYMYYCSQSFIDGDDNYMQLGFMLAPSNTTDDIFSNIKVIIYNENYQPDLDNTDNIVEIIDDFSCFNYTDEHRDRLYFNSTFKNKLHEGYVVETNFNRTCGYYYLFNGYKKEILVHLFVNGDHEGFVKASTDMRYNEYYDHYLDGFAQSFERNESELTDDDMYIDYTYSTPRSYLYTTDRRYLVSIEPTGKELEAEKHLYNYDQYGMLDNTLDNRENESGEEHGHYLTTEGYLLTDEDDVSPYTGPIVKNYNENMYIYTPLTLDLFRQNVYMKLKYPSENFSVHKNLIPRLNTVSFKNAVETY